MEMLIRLAILWLAFFVLLFPYGVLFTLRRLGPGAGVLVGGAAGLIGGLVIFGPDYRPRAADVTAIMVLTVLGATVISSVAAAVQRSGLRRPDRATSPKGARPAPRAQS